MGTVVTSPEQRVVLRSVSWDTYEHILSDHLERSAPRFTYDRGVLEIMSPSSEHEIYNRTISLLVEVIAEEINLDVENLGSTTFKRKDLKRGFEPDSCFYIQNAERIRGKLKIDLKNDPPPDLVIEIDITSFSIDKLPIYAKLGITEIWRYDGKQLAILKLEGRHYVEQKESVALPSLRSETLSQLMDASKSMKRTEWLQMVRRESRKLGKDR
jgi:Uma2 family endonuclease